MTFTLPAYTPPDLSRLEFSECQVCTFMEVTKDGVAPAHFHATSIFPEYYQVEKDDWRLPEQARMDCCAVLREDGRIEIVEPRNLRKGDQVAIGRLENGEEGIYVHSDPFGAPAEKGSEKFAFRTLQTRESAFSVDYDRLYDLLDHEREHGHIVWVLGPAVVFDHDAREAFTRLIERGYVNSLLAGNALATHDIEGSFFTTALGQNLYTKDPAKLGHYNHLDAINRVRGVGSISKCVETGLIKDGVMKALTDNNIPYVLAGSIRDDGPLPEVITDSGRAADAMRGEVRKATTVIALATQLHTIATGNMTPSYTVRDGVPRPVYFYTVDMSEFAANKLANRGSLSARSILTNVQDFVVTTERGLRNKGTDCA